MFFFFSPLISEGVFFGGWWEKNQWTNLSEAESWHIEVIEDFEFQLFLILLVKKNDGSNVPAFRWATCNFQQIRIPYLGPKSGPQSFGEATGLAKFRIFFMKGFSMYTTEN